MSILLVMYLLTDSSSRREGEKDTLVVTHLWEATQKEMGSWVPHPNASSPDELNTALTQGSQGLLHKFGTCRCMYIYNDSRYAARCKFLVQIRIRCLSTDILMWLHKQRAEEAKQRIFTRL